MLLAKLGVGEQAEVMAVFEHSTAFLQYLDQVELNLGKHITVLEKLEFDQSMRVRFGDGRELQISREVAQSIFVKRHNALV